MADAEPVADAEPMTDAGMLSFAAIILAAGSSKRLGQPKQLVLYQGEPLLRRAASLALSAGAAPVLVVVRGDLREDVEPQPSGEIRAALAGLPVLIVENPREDMGSSLRAGMAVLLELAPFPDRVLLLVCDQPLLEVDDLQALLRASAATGVAAAKYNDRLGVPAIFAQEHFKALAAVHGDHGARSLLGSLTVTAVALPAAAVDIDTPDDLARLNQAPAPL